MAKKEQIIIKKYTNRRLYNTSTSSYINLSELCELIKNNEDFIVIEVATKKDITRNAVIQIILDYETKGYDLLPVEFLKNLVKFYDASSKDVLTYFLENSAKFFSKCQENNEFFDANPFKSFNGVKFTEEINKLTQQNIDFFFKTMFQNAQPQEKAKEKCPAASEA